MGIQNFIHESWRMIEAKRLSKVEYRRTIQSLMWQLIRTVHWLHTVCHVSHSDLCFDNILLDRDPFIYHDQPDGPFPVGLSKDVVLKVVDFGVAQRTTRSLRDQLNLNEAIFQSPQIYQGEEYDPRAADCWSIGLLLYSAMTGLRLYTVEDIINAKRHRTAYRALERGALKGRFDVSRILCPLCIVSFHLFLWRRPYLIFNPVVFPECVCLEAECLRSLFSFSCVPSSNIAGETEWNLGEKQWRSKALCLSVDCCLRDF